jgi:hypothetical protein
MKRTARAREKREEPGNQERLLGLGRDFKVVKKAHFPRFEPEKFKASARNRIIALI